VFALQSGAVNARLAGSGAVLTKTGAGTAMLNAAATHTGATEVRDGILVLNGVGLGATDVTLGSGILILVAAIGIALFRMRTEDQALSEPLLFGLAAAIGLAISFLILQQMGIGKRAARRAVGSALGRGRVPAVLEEHGTICGRAVEHEGAQRRPRAELPRPVADGRERGNDQIRARDAVLRGKLPESRHDLRGLP
jgi:autotransporter-associated beta strand protein